MATWKSIIIFALAGTLLATLTRVSHSASFEAYDGKHIQLRTDAAPGPVAQRYIETFDAAVKQWSEYWNLPPATLDDWQVRAVVMSNRAAAVRAGLLEDRLPDFKFGYASGNSVYVFAQSSEYYTQHLLLHEGIHSLAQHAFGGMGPAWFMEGTAELLSTHRGSGSDIEINVIPRTRDESPYWGRLKVIRERHATGSIPTLESIMRQPGRLDGDVETYSWSWVAVMLMTEYPEYNKVFSALTSAGHDGSSELTRILYQRLKPNWHCTVARFRLLAQSLDYGYDRDRERVELSIRDPKWKGERLDVKVDPAGGWQSCGVVIPARADLHIAATGDITLAEVPKPWLSHPEGVTIEYHNGQPLGRLMGCLVPIDFQENKPLPSLEPFPIGAGATIHVKTSSWLVLRVNESVANLADNTGEFHVSIQ